MDAVLEVAEPGGCALAPDLLDARVGVAGGDGLAGDGDPVLVARVDEGDVGFTRALLKVIELLAVGVGKEKEVGAGALGYSHRAADGLKHCQWFAGMQESRLILHQCLGGTCPACQS